MMVKSKFRYNRIQQLVKVENYYLTKYIQTRKKVYRNLLIKYSIFDISDIDESIYLYFDCCNTRQRRVCRRRHKAGKDYWPYKGECNNE